MLKYIYRVMLCVCRCCHMPIQCHRASRQGELVTLIIAWFEDCNRPIGIGGWGL